MKEIQAAEPRENYLFGRAKVGLDGKSGTGLETSYHPEVAAVPVGSQVMLEENVKRVLSPAVGRHEYRQPHRKTWGMSAALKSLPLVPADFVRH